MGCIIRRSFSPLLAVRSDHNISGVLSIKRCMSNAGVLSGTDYLRHPIPDASKPAKPSNVPSQFILEGDGRFWTGVPQYKDVCEKDFLSYKWQVSNTIHFVRHHKC
jgi:hypothetical protein